MVFSLFSSAKIGNFFKTAKHLPHFFSLRNYNCEFREEGDGLYYELYEFHEFIRLTSALQFV